MYTDIFLSGIKFSCSKIKAHKTKKLNRTCMTAHHWI